MLYNMRLVESCFVLLLLSTLTGTARQLPKKPNAGLTLPSKFKAVQLIDNLGST